MKSFFPLKKANSLGKEFDKPAATTTTATATTAAAATRREGKEDGSRQGGFSAKEKGIHRSFSGMPATASAAAAGSDDTSTSTTNTSSSTVEQLMLLAPRNGSIKGGSAKAFKPTLSESFRFDDPALT